MSAYSDMARAFQIFDEYRDRQDVSAAHDEIYAGPDPVNVSAEHLAELASMDWYPAAEFNTFRRFA